MDPHPLCRLSDPAQPHKLSRRSSSIQPLSICFSCKGKQWEYRSWYYYCNTCNLEFHKGCQAFPPEIRHPYHPSHPLTLTVHPTFDLSKHFQVLKDDSDYDDDDVDDDDDSDDDDDDVGDDVVVYEEDVLDDDDYDDPYNDDDVSLEGNHKCSCCQRRLKQLSYHCSICNFNLNWRCSLTRPDLIISHTKSHSHSFNLFPKRISSPCDACGLSLGDTKDCVYSCLSCSHLIHKRCIYLPRVIMITRHRHRLSFTSSLFAGDLFCGVCRKKVDSNYGRYSCQRGCEYTVHSKCATRKAVWDGKDLEGVPEEPEVVIEPFVRIDEETILHFSHEHYLKLQEKKNTNEKTKFCEACCIPLRISQRFYGCMQCDFVLDESCASLPCKSYHPVHKHPLILYPYPTSLKSEIKSYLNIVDKGLFKCDGCNLQSCGFLYKCGENDCQFHLDVRCAALPDPFFHGCHPQDHPLFFNLTQGECMGCGSYCSSYFLECMECKSFLGLSCATLPSVAHYKHDSHPLTLCYGEKDSTSGQYWCEICEETLDSKKWFYTCDSCTITLHVRCLLGKSLYMKPNHIIPLFGHDVKIALNDGNSRVVCCECYIRCEDTTIFKIEDKYRGDTTCCSFHCMYTYLYP